MSTYALELLSPDHSGGFQLTFPAEYLKEFERRKPSPLANRVSMGGGRRPRNVIVFVLESVGTHYLSLYGSPYKTTPNLEAEARNALVFENFYCHVGMTANSLASISLSLWPYMTWREYTQDYPELPGRMLSSVFKQRGYRTAFVHNGHLDYTNQRAFLSNRGFDVLWDFADLAQGAPETSSWGGEDQLAVDGIFRFLDREPDRALLRDGLDLGHPPPLRAGSRASSRRLSNFFEGREEPFDAWNMNRYLNLVKEADLQLGRLFAGLRERGLDESTMVVVTGDHGEAFGDPHSAWGHGSRLYDEFVKVPLYVWAPRLVVQGRRFKTVGSHVDVNPTVTDLIGLPPDPPGADAASSTAPARPGPTSTRPTTTTVWACAKASASTSTTPPPATTSSTTSPPTRRSTRTWPRSSPPRPSVCASGWRPGASTCGATSRRSGHLAPSCPRCPPPRPPDRSAPPTPPAPPRPTTPHPSAPRSRPTLRNLERRPMPSPPPDVKPEILKGDLSPELLDAYLASPDLAVDTETMGLQTLRDRLCVVQMCDRKGRSSLVQITRETLDPRATPPPPGRRGSRSSSRTSACSRSSTSPASTWRRCGTGSASPCGRSTARAR